MLKVCCSVIVPRTAPVVPRKLLKILVSDGVNVTLADEPEHAVPTVVSVDSMSIATRIANGSLNSSSHINSESYLTPTLEYTQNLIDEAQRSINALRDASIVADLDAQSKIESKLAETKSTESKSTETKPTETKPAE